MSERFRLDPAGNIDVNLPHDVSFGKADSLVRQLNETIDLNRPVFNALTATERFPEWLLANIQRKLGDAATAISEADIEFVIDSIKARKSVNQQGGNDE